jgi:HAD superfamily hydrolase (TIGR01549 family)
MIFDLDGTLLDTGAVREARRARDWAAVEAGLNRVHTFQAEGAIGPEALPAAVRAQGLKVGIVTHAPRWYAETLLDQFGIPFDAMITGSDPYPPKPDPTSLLQVAAEMNIEIRTAAYVGDEGIDMAASAAAGATSIGACWSRQPPQEWRRWWPDMALARPEHVLDIDGISRRRPLAEVVLDGEEPSWHWGTLMRLSPDVLSCGRYFTPQDIARHPGHALSALVLAAKEDEESARRAAALMASAAARPTWRREPPQLVASVPPRPSQVFDRFGPVREAMAEALDARDGENCLIMEFEVPDYKGMAYDDRRAANVDRFRSNPLSGESVLLVDDVMTSGSQTEECRAALMAAGAGDVTVLVLSATQSRLPESCPNCGAYLRVYAGSRGGFIGCPNYFRTGCTYTRDL